MHVRSLLTIAMHYRHRMGTMHTDIRRNHNSFAAAGVGCLRPQRPAITLQLTYQTWSILAVAFHRRRGRCKKHPYIINASVDRSDATKTETEQATYKLFMPFLAFRSLPTADDCSTARHSRRRNWRTILKRLNVLHWCRQRSKTNRENWLTTN